VQWISNCLPLKESGRLRAVCRAWRELSDPVMGAKVWLLYSPKEDGTCNVFDPFEGKTHELHLEILSSDKAIRFHFSKDGWVVVSEWDNLFYLLNPITQDFYSLPSPNIILSIRHIRHCIFFSAKLPMLCGIWNCLCTKRRFCLHLHMAAWSR
jgi:hypothetical protein